MTVKLGLDEEQGLKGRLRTAMHGVEAKLDEASLDGLTIKMLMMRRHEKDFMLRGKEKYLGEIRKRRAEFDPLLAAADIPDTEKAAIGKLMDTYEAGVLDFGGLAIALVPETKRLSAVYAEMGPHLEALQAFSAKALAAVKAEVATTQRMTSRTITLTSVVAAVVMLVLGVLTMRSLTAPLRRLTGATARLASGERDVDVPITGNRDELGAMARALLVFKDNLAETERLRLEQEDAKKRSAQERRQFLANMADRSEKTVGAIVKSVSGTSAGQMLGASNDLLHQAERLDREVQTFLTDIRG